MKNPQSNLPPGFRFHPTDEELILHYLRKRVASIPLPVSIVAEVDIYKCDPWDLPAKALFGEKEWYFFTPRERKYPNGARPNRAAISGYWKATGTDKTIVTLLGGGRRNIGVKKVLVFYKGRPPKGVKTNWIMHEYRLAESPNYSSYNIKNHSSNSMKLKDSSMRLDDWVLCRIYKKSSVISSTNTTTALSDQHCGEEGQEHHFSKNTLMSSLASPNTGLNTLKSQKSLSFTNLLDAVDYSMLSNFLSDDPFNPNGFESSTAPPTNTMDDMSSTHKYINYCSFDGNNTVHQQSHLGCHDFIFQG